MNNSNKKVLLSCDNLFNQLYSLESILQTTKETCQGREFSAIYYNLKQKEKFTLSQERNNYINMLELALARVSDIMEINNGLETEISKL